MAKFKNFQCWAEASGASGHWESTIATARAFFSAESCELRRADVQGWWRELCIFFDWFTFSSIGHTKGQLLFSGQAHSSLWCLTCLGRQPARWVVYRFHFWPNGSEDERMWEASGWCWGCPSVRTNRPSRAPQRLSARHWMNKQLVRWHSKKVAHVTPSSHSPLCKSLTQKINGLSSQCQTRFNTKNNQPFLCLCFMLNAAKYGQQLVFWGSARNWLPLAVVMLTCCVWLPLIRFIFFRCL